MAVTFFAKNQFSYPKSLIVMNKLKNSLPKYILKLIYVSLVQSHLQYGLIVWGGNFGKSNRLVTLQKKAIRIISNSNYIAHTEPIFKKLQILKLCDMYRLQNIRLYYNAINLNCPFYINSLISKMQITHHYNTRQKLNTFKSLRINKIQDQAICRKIDQTWNELPNIIKSLKDLTNKYTFIKKIKEYFINSYSVTCINRNCYSCKQNTK